MKKYTWTVVALALAFALGAVVSRQVTGTAMAADEQVGRIGITLDSKEAKLKGVPVMVSVIKDGAVVYQSEAELGWFGTDRLPHGMYDVRFEGDGIQTLVKRGVQITDGQLDLRASLAAGQGVRIVEYAVGGLAREEVAARLMKLEAAVGELQKK